MHNPLLIEWRSQGVLAVVGFSMYKSRRGGGVLSAKKVRLSARPDGQRIAFSSMGANPEQSQVWVMENFLPVEKAKK